MEQKNNAQSYLDVLKQHGIKKLYHFTDRENLESIFRHGGLYSWQDCENKGIVIPRPGGSSLSRDLDRRYGLANFVRLSFTNDHPMKSVAMTDGRIANPVVLEVSIDVVTWKGTKFSDSNAAWNGCHFGEQISDLERVHFSTTQARYHDLDEDDKHYYQAEIMVPHFVPLQYITNIENFGYKLPQPATIVSKTPYTAQITRATPTAFIFMIDQSCSMRNKTILNGESMSKADAVARIVNHQIEELINRCIKTNEIRHYYDMALIGYGHEVRCGWNGELEGKLWASPQELHDHPFKKITTKEEKRTRKGVVVKEVEKVAWIESNCSGSWTHMRDAFSKAKELMDGWLEKYHDKDCYPPTIINITDGEYNGSTRDEIQDVTNEIRSLFTNDGNVQIFNIHISSGDGRIVFPTDISELEGDDYGQDLYNFSSLLPVRYNPEIAKLRGDDPSLRHRAMAMNADMGTLIQLMDIGTPTNINASL